MNLYEFLSHCDRPSMPNHEKGEKLNEEEEDEAKNDELI